MKVVFRLHISLLIYGGGGGGGGGARLRRKMCFCSKADIIL